MSLRAAAFLASLVALAGCGDEPRTEAPPPPRPDGPARYVAPTGSDAAPGTRARPWRTLRHALEALRPGDTLYVRGGRYSERLGGDTPIEVAGGTADAPILVRAYARERPVLEGLLWLEAPSFWTVDGLAVTWRDDGEPDEHMVKVEGGERWRLTNMEIWGARSFAGLLVAGDPDGWRVDHSCIHDTIPANGTNQDHNVYVNTGLDADSGLLERNVVFGAPNGSNVKVAGADADEGSDDVTIRRNTLVDAAAPVLVGGETSDTLIERNVIAEGRRGHLIRGYELDGEGNVARDNVGYGADRFVLNDDDSGEGVADGGGNVLRGNPRFDERTCAGFDPEDAEADGFGHLAPE